MRGETEHRGVGGKLGCRPGRPPFKLPKSCLLNVKYGCCGLEQGFILPSSGKRLKRASKGRRQLERRLCCLLHIRPQKSGSLYCISLKCVSTEMRGSYRVAIRASRALPPQLSTRSWITLSRENNTRIRWWRGLYGSLTIDSEAERANA